MTTTGERWLLAGSPGAADGSRLRDLAVTAVTALPATQAPGRLCATALGTLDPSFPLPTAPWSDAPSALPRCDDGVDQASRDLVDESGGLDASQSGLGAQYRDVHGDGGTRGADGGSGQLPSATPK